LVSRGSLLRYCRASFVVASSKVPRLAAVVEEFPPRVDTRRHGHAESAVHLGAVTARKLYRFKVGDRRERAGAPTSKYSATRVVASNGAATSDSGRFGSEGGVTVGGRGPERGTWALRFSAMFDVARLEEPLLGNGWHAHVRAGRPARGGGHRCRGLAVVAAGRDPRPMPSVRCVAAGQRIVTVSVTWSWLICRCSAGRPGSCGASNAGVARPAVGPARRVTPSTGANVLTPTPTVAS
jgi:hypothetical protein